MHILKNEDTTEDNNVIVRRGKIIIVIDIVSIITSVSAKIF